VPCSITQAQAKVRILEQDIDRDVDVVLADGTYRLSSPLRLDSRDSGTHGFDVVWTAAPGAHPVLSGGTRIIGWHESDTSKGIWAAAAPAGLQTRQLYVDGVRAQRAAGPLPVTLTKTDTGYTASSDAMASWRNPSEIEFVYIGDTSLDLSSAFDNVGITDDSSTDVGKLTIRGAHPGWGPSRIRGRETTEGPAHEQINSRLGVTHLPEPVSPRNRNRVRTRHPGGGTDVSTIYRDCTVAKGSPMATTWHQRRRWPPPGMGNGQVIGVELRGLEPLTPTLPVGPRPVHCCASPSFPQVKGIRCGRRTSMDSPELTLVATKMAPQGRKSWRPFLRASTSAGRWSSRSVGGPTRASK
jgi:hypothetical protein